MAATGNRFNLLDDEPNRKPKANKSKVAASPAAPAAHAATEPRENNRGGRGRGGHGGRGRSRGEDRIAASGESRQQRTYDRRQPGGRRGPRKTGDGWDNDADTVKQSQQAEQAFTDDAVDPAAAPAEGEEAAADAKAPEVPAEPEEPPTKSLEEAMEEKKKNFVKKEVAVRTSRNEGFQGKNVVAKPKAQEEKKAVSEKKLQKRTAISLDEFSPAPVRRERRDDRPDGERGGRGRGRGRGRGERGRGRNQPRGPRTAKLNLKDDELFPKVGAS